MKKMKNYLLILAVLLGGGVNAQGQTYRQLNIESNTDKYNRESEEAKHKQKLERIRQGESNLGNVSNTIVNPNASVLQKNSYSDGMVLAFIEKKGHQFAHNCGSNANDKHDRLQLENIGNRNISVKYSYKSVLYDCSDILQEEKIGYHEVTLRPGEKYVESGYLSNGKIGYFFIDSFSVMYVKMYEESQNYTAPQIQQTQQQEVQVQAQVQQLQVVTLYDYLYIFPEDLGYFSTIPDNIISAINNNTSYGHNDWRVPTIEEMALITGSRNKIANLSANQYMTSDGQSSGALRLVRTRKTANTESTHNTSIPNSDHYTCIETQETKQYADVMKAGQEFLVENATRKGVITLPIGLQYEVITEGTGPKPTDNNKVKVHYTASLIDGTVFDSSIERGEPTVFGVNQVIPGWTYALKMMPVGSKWKLYIPYELGYGSKAAGPIKPYSALIFNIELLDIEK